MQIKQKQQGFTLIELVVVIIILGILAVTAAPKFINLQGDARVSALQGLKGAIQGANTLVYSKAALAGQEKEDDATVILVAAADAADNVTVEAVYGYMSDDDITNFQNALEVSISAGTDPSLSTITTDWIFDVATGKFWQAGAPSACFFTYGAATATTVPSFTAIPDASAC
ncbi:prepilin-type N-terminal cleavage/methylation domain-containing protein [Shewanella electrodiphila]|uniref:Prepilin-type N-terminal cleavage/methylation domain-containing protein n=1 Tax=Shewanella electrodiphila TaxID=934143 RepID=A0ABT0KS62_9GAMM|nr:prepilin-type N-terminal cleavage/methylation domain-containing protein [Shewanella electrodiphila]MCL1046361.1 prepilin-type N-terminal cleavage/methylation domain-containing protein [Shewanella electrodiphila]